MTKRIFTVLTLVVVAGLTGCAKKNAYRGGVVADPTIVGDVAAMPGAEVRPVTWFDRHPLFRKPAECFHKTGHGVIVKTTAATFVGVPKGIVCEVGQIFKGCPPGL